MATPICARYGCSVGTTRLAMSLWSLPLCSSRGRKRGGQTWLWPLSSLVCFCIRPFPSLRTHGTIWAWPRGRHARSERLQARGPPAMSALAPCDMPRRFGNVRSSGATRKRCGQTNWVESDPVRTSAHLEGKAMIGHVSKHSAGLRRCCKPVTYPWEDSQCTCQRGLTREYWNGVWDVK
jgi:hypothetical protein